MLLTLVLPSGAVAPAAADETVILTPETEDSKAVRHITRRAALILYENENKLYPQ